MQIKKRRLEDGKKLKMEPESRGDWRKNNRVQIKEENMLIGEKLKSKLHLDLKGSGGELQIGCQATTFTAAQIEIMEGISGEPKHKGKGGDEGKQIIIINEDVEAVRQVEMTKQRRESGISCRLLMDKVEM